MLIMLAVSLNATSTSFVIWIRVLRKAEGAKFMNQSLYIFIDLAISLFQFCGLSRLTVIITHFIIGNHYSAPTQDSLFVLKKIYQEHGWQTTGLLSKFVTRAGFKFQISPACLRCSAALRTSKTPDLFFYKTFIPTLWPWNFLLRSSSLYLL